MKATFPRGGALLALLLAASSAPAWTNGYYSNGYPHGYYGYPRGSGYLPPPALNYPRPYAPSPATMPGFYAVCPGPCHYGPIYGVYGPNYCLRPPFQPFNGILPGSLGKFIQTGHANTAQAPALGPTGPRGPGPMAPAGPMGPMGPMGPIGPMGPVPPDAFEWKQGPMGPVLLPNPGAGMQPQAPTPPEMFLHHPYVRSPRDFFMWREMMEEKTSRELRQPLLP